MNWIVWPKTLNSHESLQQKRKGSKCHVSLHTTDHKPKMWQTNRLGWISFRLQITSWTMTEALALAPGLAAFCMVSCVFLLPPFCHPTALIPSFGLKKHFKQQKEECFSCNWLGFCSNRRKKMLKRMKRTPHFRDRIFYLVWRLLVRDDFREHRMDGTDVNYSTISQSTSPTDMKARAVTH